MIGCQLSVSPPSINSADSKIKSRPTHTQTITHTNTHRDSSFQKHRYHQCQKGETEMGEKARHQKQKSRRRNVKGRGSLLMNEGQHITHSETHTHPLACHDGHFAYWTWHTRKQACHKGCCFSILPLDVCRSFSLYPNSPSGKLAGCLGLLEKLFHASCEVLLNL